MDLSLLQIYAHTMRRGSFAAVARERGVDPSSISRAIQTLEAELQVRLFQRTTRRLAPTEEGAAYFARISPLIEELEQAGSEATDARRQPTGLLRITASVAFGQCCLVPLLPAFHARYPDLRLDLLLTDAIVDLVPERVDLAIRLGPQLPDSGLIAHQLLKVRYRVVASPEYLKHRGRPQQPAELTMHACLAFRLPRFQSCWVFVRNRGQTIEVPIQPMLTASSAIALRDCALAGMGPALLPQWLVREALAAGTLVDLFPEHEVTATDFNTAAWMLLPSRRYVPAKVRHFMNYLRESFPA